MTKTKMIVLWGCVEILTSALKFFLAANPAWNVVTISSKHGEDALFRAVDTTHPDIVILHRGSNNCVANLPMRLLEGYSAIKVITISLDNNALEVYTKQNIWVKQPSDLISVIENES